MPAEPSTKRTVAFFDGQNLYHGAREAFGYQYPNYSPLKLATRVCADQGWLLQQICFYTGLPDPAHKNSWHQFWTAKMGAMGHRGINGTDWIKINRATYDACLDTKDYRPKGHGGAP